MKTCVIYAASIFDSLKIYVVNDFFSTFKTHFPDADFYVGVNYGSLPSLEEEIRKYGLNCNIGRLQDGNLYTKTDASAYQVAINVLKQTGKTYDIYWFAHTKGGANSRDEIRRMYLDEMFGKRESIEKMFEEYPMLGSWGIRGNSVSAANIQWKDYNVDSFIPICANIKQPPFNYTHVNWSYIETLYVLKKEAVESYVQQLPPEFFITKLDPWYFETVPGWIPSRCGYFPYVKEKRDFWGHCDLTDITKLWIEENGLTQQLPYLSLQ